MRAAVHDKQCTPDANKLIVSCKCSVIFDVK